jgi:hypothetical protein
MHDMRFDSRRRFLSQITRAGAVAALLPIAARADALPPLSPSDPTAQALAYAEDSAKVDAAKSPTHKAGQACLNCRFFSGDKAVTGPCQLFPGKAVAAKGWCSGYNAKG